MQLNQNILPNNTILSNTEFPEPPNPAYPLSGLTHHAITSPTLPSSQSQLPPQQRSQNNHTYHPTQASTTCYTPLSVTADIVTFASSVLNDEYLPQHSSLHIGKHTSNHK